MPNSNYKDMKQIKLNVNYTHHPVGLTSRGFVSVTHSRLQRLLLLSAFFLVAVCSATAREKPDTTYLFRFQAEKDMFFSPWNDNDKELERLLKAIDENRTAIEDGTMRILVSSYGTEAANGQSAEQLARIRRNRVKSELIIRADIKEEHFLTRKETAGAYGTDRLRNVVVVILPVDSGKNAEADHLAAEQERQAEAGRIAKEKEQAEQKRLAEEKAAKERAEQAEQERLAAGQAVKKQGKEEQTKTTAHHFLQGWYAGVQGGLPFGISGMSSFGADKTRVGWNVGLYGGYRFSSVFSLEAQLRFGGLGLGNQSCCAEAGYWLGADGMRYFAPVNGMEGWAYSDLMSRVTTQHYGVQLNVNVLGFFNATKDSRWRLEVSPLLAAVGTKASIRTLSGNAEVMDSESRWHFGAGGNLQASYAVTRNLNIGIYSGITYLTGKSMDGLPPSVHRNNFIWDSGVRIGWAFGKKSKDL